MTPLSDELNYGLDLPAEEMETCQLEEVVIVDMSIVPIIDVEGSEEPEKIGSVQTGEE